MIKIDDNYSIGENGYGFVLYKLREGGKRTEWSGTFTRSKEFTTSTSDKRR